MGWLERCPPAHEGLFKMDWLNFENALTIIILELPVLWRMSGGLAAESLGSEKMEEKT